MTPSGRHWAISFLVVAGLAILITALSSPSSAQTDPPDLGWENWTVADTTVMEGRFIMLKGDLLVESGGELTLDDTMLLFACAEPGEFGLTVESGGSLHIVNGSTIAAARMTTPWTFEARNGSSLRVLDSTVAACGVRAYGLHPVWEELGMYVGTSDATIEDTRFYGGFIGLVLARDVLAAPVRNCSFENYYGIVTWGTSVEDCTFRDQQYYGVLVHGGRTTNISRCRFEGIYSTCIQVGFHDIEFGVIHPAAATIRDCSILRSVRGVRIAPLSFATIADCTFDGIEDAAFYAEPTSGALLVNGHYSNCSVAILSDRNTTVAWTVTDEAAVVGGNVTLSGDLVLGAGAEARLLECRDLTMLSDASTPLSLTLGAGANLVLVNGSLQVPDRSAGSLNWTSVRLEGARGRLSLTGVTRINVSYPVELEELVCVDTTLPLGEWRVERVHLENCSLVPDPGGYPPLLTIHAPPGQMGMGDAGELVHCRLGDPTDPFPINASWLVLEAGRLRSLDFLHGTRGLIEDGLVGLPEQEGIADLEVLWSMTLRVQWQNQDPIPGARVTLTDSLGTSSVLVADGEGNVPAIHLMSERAMSSTSVTYHYPFDLVTNVAGLQGSLRIFEVVSAIETSLIVVDLVAPELEVDQGHSMAMNVNVTHIRGRGLDSHSDLSFMEVAVLPYEYSRVPLGVDGAFDVEVRFKVGFQTVALRLYDKVGNRVTWLIEVYYTTSPPYLIVQEPLSGSWLNTDHVYVSGLTEPNSTVTVNGIPHIAVNGSFGLPLPLDEGENLLMITSVSPAGNQNRTLLVVHRDTVPPALVVTHPTGSPFTTRNPNVTVTGTTGPGCQVFLDSEWIEVGENGTFSAALSLSQGSTTITIRAVDIAGNTASLEVEFLIDSLPPFLRVLWPPRGELLTNTTAVTIRILTDPGTNLTIGNESFIAEAAEVIHTIALGEGYHEITIGASDQAGNTEVVRSAVWVDLTPPLLELVPSLPARTASALVWLNGTTEPGSTVEVNGERATVGLDGRFSVMLLLSEGINHIEVVSRDRHGNRVAGAMDVEMVPTPQQDGEGVSTLVPALLIGSATFLVVEVAILRWLGRRRREGDTEANR